MTAAGGDEWGTGLRRAWYSANDLNQYTSRTAPGVADGEIQDEHKGFGFGSRLWGKVQFLIEVKAVGLELKDGFVKQAVDYAANKGVEWVVLTNGVTWRVYKVSFGKPIDQELVFECDFLTLDPKNGDHLERLYTLSKEGWLKQVLGDLHQRRQILSKFLIGAVCVSDPVVDVIRRELRRIFSDVKISTEQVAQVLLTEVIKREVVEGEKADEARKKLSRSANKMLRVRTEKDAANGTTPEPTVPPEPTPPTIQVQG